MSAFLRVWPTSEPQPSGGRRVPPHRVSAALHSVDHFILAIWSDTGHCGLNPPFPDGPGGRSLFIRWEASSQSGISCSLHIPFPLGGLTFFCHVLGKSLSARACLVASLTWWLHVSLSYCSCCSCFVLRTKVLKFSAVKLIVISLMEKPCRSTPLFSCRSFMVLSFLWRSASPWSCFLFVYSMRRS